jgi:hypothetical protein
MCLHLVINWQYGWGRAAISRVIAARPQPTRIPVPSLEFDPTKINSTSQDSPKTVEVENIGNASLKFSALSYPADFPMASGDNECTSSALLPASGTCALVIDFSPVTAFSSGSSKLLKEAVKFTTSDLNQPKRTQQVMVAGEELR